MDSILYKKIRFLILIYQSIVSFMEPDPVLDPYSSEVY